MVPISANYVYRGEAIFVGAPGIRWNGVGGNFGGLLMESFCGRVSLCIVKRFRFGLTKRVVLLFEKCPSAQSLSGFLL